ncbi:MAG: DUF1365 family protein [Actinomycetota bacterium]|nr:DUF1365 family protein [Actinomycetota bacterium]
MSTALYRTRITHLRRSPVHHYFEHRSYSWFVDVDSLPQPPRWLRPFATFDARDHLWESADDTLRGRVESFLAGKGVELSGGRITALFQPRVMGYVFNPLSLYWCHDAHGTLRHVIAEVHNAAGARHAYLLPPSTDRPAMVAKKFRASPFNAVDGHYLVHAPAPDEELDVRISLHRDDHPAFVATMRGTRRRAGIAQILALQLTAPLSPLMNAMGMRVQAMMLWLRRVPLVPEEVPKRHKVDSLLPAGRVSANAVCAHSLSPRLRRSGD